MRDRLFNIGRQLAETTTLNNIKSAKNYWTNLNQIVYGIANINIEEFEDYKKQEILITKNLGLKGILFWELKILDFKTLSKDESIKLLIKSEKIENMIVTIKKAITSDLKLI